MNKPKLLWSNLSDVNAFLVERSQIAIRPSPKIPSTYGGSTKY